MIPEAVEPGVPESRSGLDLLSGEAMATLMLDLERTQAALERERNAHRHTREQFTALLADGAAVRDRERRRMAHDIHDHVGQEITALRMHLEALRTMCVAGTALYERAMTAECLARRLEESVDGLTRSLRLPTVEASDLSTALHQLVNDWSNRFGTPATYRESGRCPIAATGEVATHAYGIVQEALHNVAKHARAGRVRVSLQRRRRAMLLVEDDGQGFDPSVRAVDRGALGLISMRERAALSGCDLEIASAPCSGTMVRIRLPLRATESR